MAGDVVHINEKIQIFLGVVLGAWGQPAGVKLRVKKKKLQVNEQKGKDE